MLHNNMKKILLASAVVAALGVPCARAQQTRLLTAEKHNEYGLVYSLPLTALSIEVTARHEVRTAGPYWQYARKYIGTDKAISNNSDTWTVTSVSVTPYGVPDSGRQYLMQLKPGAVTTICVGADGMLLAVNKHVDDPQPQVAPEGTRTQPGGSERIDPREYLQYVDEDFIASQSTAKQAQMLAESLMEIRDAKISLTRGTADTMPTDGRQLELMLNSLAHQEAAMTAAFLGTLETETVTRTYTYVPDEEGSQILFRMSDFAGFVGSDNYAGAPVYINVQVTNRGEMPLDAKGEPKKLPKDAVMYCVPGSAEVALTLDDDVLYRREFDFAQYGLEFGLNPALFTDRKAPSFATFDPATGALREIGVLRGDEIESARQ